MRYRIILDTTLIADEPVGWDTLVTTITRDRNLKGILITNDCTLKFLKGTDGHTYINNIFENFTFCSLINCTIQQSRDAGNTWTDFYIGIIFIKNIEINEGEGGDYISTKVEDNGFYARIFNNKSLETKPFYTGSKNNVDITAYLPPLVTMRFFVPTTGIYHINAAGDRTATGYKLYDIFKFLIAFMTDAKVEFDSTLFGAGGEWENVILTYGGVVSTVRTGLVQADFEEGFPKINYETFFKEVSRLFNLAFYFDTDTANKPRIWIEKYDDVFIDTVIHSCTDIDRIKTRFLVDQIYSKVNIGTSITLDSTDPGAYPEDIALVGFKNETFNLIGECNIDRTLDLTGEFVISHNVIMDAVENLNTTYDEHLFFINCNPLAAGTYDAIETNVLTGVTPPFYYNEAFTNQQVLTRYLGAIPNSIAQYVGNGNDEFLAVLSADENFNNGNIVGTGLTTIIPFPFDNDIPPDGYDPNTNYDAGGNFDYTIPSTGVYTFAAKFKVWIQMLFPAPSMDISVRIQVYDAGGYPGTIYNQSNVTQIIAPVAGIYQVDLDVVLNGAIIPGTYRVITTAAITLSGYPGVALKAKILKGSYFTCIRTVNGGGIFQPFDPEDYSILLPNFEYPISESNFDNIRANAREQISYSGSDGILKLGFIEQIKMNHQKGLAQITLNSSKTLND